LYSALHGIQTTLKRSDMDHTVLPAINTMPAISQGSVGENCYMLTSCLGLHQCLVASCLHVHYAVKHDMGNHSWGRRAVKSQGNVAEFCNAGEWSSCNLYVIHSRSSQLFC